MSFKIHRNPLRRPLVLDDGILPRRIGLCRPFEEVASRRTTPAEGARPLREDIVSSSAFLVSDRETAFGRCRRLEKKSSTTYPSSPQSVHTPPRSGFRRSCACHGRTSVFPAVSASRVARARYRIPRCSSATHLSPSQSPAEADRRQARLTPPPGQGQDKRRRLVTGSTAACRGSRL